LPGSTPSFK